MQHHKFDVKSFAKLDNPERRKILPPTEILQKFGLVPGNIVADVGCGIGYFTLSASGIVGLDGKVIAMDISAEMLAQVRKNAQQCGASNIETIQIGEQNMVLADDAVDVGIAFFVLHEAEEPSRFLSELNRIIKPGGKLAVMEWEKRQTPTGPPVAHRVDKEEAIAWLTQAGFAVETVAGGGDFYSLLGIKKAALPHCPD